MEDDFNFDVGPDDLHDTHTSYADLRAVPSLGHGLDDAGDFETFLGDFDGARGSRNELQLDVDEGVRRPLLQLLDTKTEELPPSRIPARTQTTSTADAAISPTQADGVSAATPAAPSSPIAAVPPRHMTSVTAPPPLAPNVGGGVQPARAAAPPPPGGSMADRLRDLTRRNLRFGRRNQLQQQQQQQTLTGVNAAAPDQSPIGAALGLSARSGSVAGQSMPASAMGSPSHSTELPTVQPAQRRWQPKERRRVVWTAEMRQRFYEGLRRFGLNMDHIARMFPTLTREDIVRRYKAEREGHHREITEALAPEQRIATDPEELRAWAHEWERQRTMAPQQDIADDDAFALAQNAADAEEMGSIVDTKSAEPPELPVLEPVTAAMLLSEAFPSVHSTAASRAGQRRPRDDDDFFFDGGEDDAAAAPPVAPSASTSVPMMQRGFDLLGEDDDDDVPLMDRLPLATIFQSNAPAPTPAVSGKGTRRGGTSGKEPKEESGRKKSGVSAAAKPAPTTAAGTGSSSAGVAHQHARATGPSRPSAAATPPPAAEAVRPNASVVDAYDALGEFEGVGAPAAMVADDDFLGADADEDLTF